MKYKKRVRNQCMSFKVNNDMLHSNLILTDATGSSFWMISLVFIEKCSANLNLMKIELNIRNRLLIFTYFLRLLHLFILFGVKNQRNSAANIQMNP